MDILIKLYSFRAPLWLPLLTTWESVFMFGALKIINSGGSCTVPHQIKSCNI